MTTSNRRDFLKRTATTSTGLAVSGLLPRRIFAAESAAEKKIAYRELGTTGCKITEIGFGAMNMGDSALVQAGLDAGINYFDTAWYYMHGVNEETVGKVLKPVRKKVFLTTKVIPATPKEMMTMMETSLKRLQTDHVDLMLLHGINSREMALNEDFMKVIDSARKKGMTRFIGVSTHENHVAVMDGAVESKLWQAVLVGYNYMSPPEIKAAIARTHKAGLGIVAMKTLLNPVDLATWNWEPIKDIRKDKEAKITPNQALIKWVLEDKNVDAVIPGVTSFEQLEEDVAVMGMKMSFRERRSLARYAEAVDNGGGYCRGAAGCTGCREKCPYGVDICGVNRCLRYAYGYGNIELARAHYSRIPSNSRAAACGNCGECQVNCVNGLNLTENVRRARELFG
jgi:uncharacterized protein